MRCSKSVSDYGAVQTQRKKIVTAREGSTEKFVSLSVLRANQPHTKLYLQNTMDNGDLFF